MSIFFEPKSRRQFLGSVGKAALALPFLPSLARNATAAIPNGGLIILAVRNGVFGQDWSPYVYQQLSASAPLGNTGQPGHQVRVAQFSAANRVGINDVLHNTLPGMDAAMRDKITLLMGLDSGSLGAGHGPTAAGAIADNESLDQVLGYGRPSAFSKVYGNCEPALRTLHLATPFGPESGPSVSFRRVGAPTAPLTQIPSIQNVMAAYDSLLVKGNPAAAARSLAALEMVKQESGALRSRASGSDYRLFQQYFDMVHSLGSKIQAVCAPNPSLGSLMGRPAAGSGLSSAVLADLQTSLAVAAIQSGATRVVTIYIQGWDNYDAGAWHTDSHTRDVTVPRFLSNLRNVAQHYFLATIRKLEQAGLLNDSLVYMGNDISHPFDHTCTNMPVLLGGQAGGMITPGRCVSYMRQQSGLELFNAPGYHRGALMTQFFDSILQSPMFGLTPSDYALSGEQGFGRARHPVLPDALYSAVRTYHGRILPGLSG